MVSTGGNSEARFRDPLLRLCCFAGEILVRCPRCGGQASVLPDPPAAVTTRHMWLRRRLSCLACANTGVWEAPAGRGALLPKFTGPEDPYFGLPLWLTVECCGHVLWAYNAEHLDLLQAYAAARLRERGTHLGTMSLVERLPAWIKDAKHRDEVLQGISRLQAKLPQPGERT